MLRVFAVSARSLSSKAHVAPKRIHGTEGRYAGAIYVAASKAGLLDKVEAELGAIEATINKNQGFANYLTNPTVPREVKATKVMSLLGEDKFSNPTRNLVQTLAGNGRLAKTSKVIAAFQELMEASRGVVKATVITAEALSAANAKSVQGAVGNMVEGGKKVEIEYKVDASILGGMQIQVGDKFMDLSVANRINNVNTFLNSA